MLAIAPVLPSVPEAAPQLTAGSAADALFARLEARPAVSTVKLDVESLNAALAGTAQLTYALAAQDTPTAPTRLTDFRLELLGGKPSTLFTAKEVLVWNADTDALISRLNGRQLDSKIRLFDRIEMASVKFDMTQYTNAVDEAVNAAMPTGETVDIGYDDASMNAGRVIFGGMTLHPWTFEENEG